VPAQEEMLAWLESKEPGREKARHRPGADSRRPHRAHRRIGDRAAAPRHGQGFVFLSMEDETGIMNAIITPQTFDRFKFEVLAEPFLIIDGVLQNLDGVISVKAARVAGLRAGAAAASHDFH
jgi:hypothetical protein